MVDAVIVPVIEGVDQTDVGLAVGLLGAPKLLNLSLVRP